MKRALLPILLLGTLGCASAPHPVAPASAVAPPCDPRQALINATLWVQSSPEYKAVALQTFANARRALDAALADPTWVGAAEESQNDPSQPPAVVLDLDETAISNLPFQARLIRTERPNRKSWTGEAAAPAIPGAAEFLHYAAGRGVTLFYVTNRDADEEPATLRNLEALGFPVNSNPDTLLLRGKRPEWGSDKSSRRAFVAGTHRILLLIGDDINDFVAARDKTTAELDAIIDQTAAWWGTRWFVIPNPMYGTWERAVTGGTGTPCEQLQRKVEALRTEAP
jgi:5'-nucleotidase (lipoprotein e(P4) family)